jgi:hypothetical protein
MSSGFFSLAGYCYIGISRLSIFHVSFTCISGTDTTPPPLILINIRIYAREYMYKKVQQVICNVHRHSYKNMIKNLLFPVPLNNFHLYGDVTIAGEGLQNVGLCSVLRTFQRKGSLSCHICCDTGPRFFRFHPKDRPIHSPLTTHKGM